MSVIYKMNKPKSTVSAIRLKSVSEDESEVSTAYVIAKDEEGNIAELRSLPNGVKDEIRVSGGKAELIQRNKKYVLQASDVISIGTSTTNVDFVRIAKPIDYIAYGVYPDISAKLTNIYSSNVTIDGFRDDTSAIGNLYSAAVNYFGFVVPKGTTLEQARTLLVGTELIYQLAEPVEIPIEVSGNIVSYPSGTIYIERVVPDAGIYTDKMTVLHQDLPIKALEKISKVDFDTGLETELDITAAVIAEDKLSFTHPDLVDGDIVFFIYEYDRESTVGETEIEYYDSRYVIKDSVTGKFYKWHLAVADGVPSIKLTEV